MLVYHYASEKHSVLKTLEKQGKISKEEKLKEEELYAIKCKKYKYSIPGYYYEHISFFFDKVPIDIIADCFNHEHEFWKSGSQIYQYTVDTDKIGNFLYEIVESPEKTDLVFDESISEKDYYILHAKMVIENKYIGKNSSELEKASSKFIGTTRQYFKALKERDNFNDLKKKYAATVPHVMIYPHLGQIKYSSVEKVQIA